MESDSTFSVNKSSRSESVAFFVFIATIILAPLSFWPSPYFALDMVKTLIIAVGTLTAAIFCGLTIVNERKISLPPRSIFWTSTLLAVSMLASALTSVHLMKSLLGQGFEIGTASFLIVVFISGLIAYMLVFRESSRAVIIYVASVSAYLILFIFQLLRLIFGPGFASLSILNSTTATILGSWNSFGLYSGVVVLISILALLLLPLSRSMKICYAILALVGAAGVFIVDSPNIWFIVSLILLAFTIFTSIGRPKTGNGFFSSLAKRVAWLPLVLFLIAAVFTWQEGKWSAPVLNKLQAQSSELSLPWQMTLDVVAGSIKNYPLLGVGPNHFSQAYLAYKPAGINQGDGWGIEFDSGFGLIPTFVATQGLIGAVLWIMFFVFLGILGAKVLRRLPNDPRGRFIVSSSFAATVFLWLSAIFFVPSHALLFLTLVMTGVFFGSVASFDLLPSFNLAPSVGTRMYKFMPSLLIICMVISAIWGLVYVKKAVALSDFGMGVKQLTVTGNSASADAYFRKALAIDLSDVYWQARAEAALAQASQLAAGVTAQTPASTTEQVLGQVTTYANSALNYAQNAIAYDPSNYYNYVSEARVSAAAANYRITTAYDNAVKAYNQAIALNQQNPSLYLNLAQLQASQNKLDDALKTIGATLQVKSNYLDAIYLLSQVDAAKGNLPEAITAAQYAITINASSSLLYFQLGTLQYNNKDYKSAADALTKAVQLTPNYSNAQYFLGLAESRLGNNTDAITQFAQLAKANPDNKEVSQILANLQAGKSIFTDTTASTTPNTENRPTLPIKQK